MKSLFAGTCLAAVCAVGLAAQTPTSQPPASSSAQKDDKAVTVTGCLKAGSTAGTYELTNAKMGSSSGSSATGTSGAAGAAGSASASAGQTIKLTGDPSGAKLSDHVGHTVQVTGKIAGAGSSTSGTSGTGAGAGTGTSGTAGSSAAKTLDVDSVKMVSSSCDDK
jgi:hypothetical protein